MQIKKKSIPDSQISSIKDYMENNKSTDTLDLVDVVHSEKTEIIPPSEKNCVLQEISKTLKCISTKEEENSATAFNKINKPLHDNDIDYCPTPEIKSYKKLIESLIEENIPKYTAEYVNNWMKENFDDKSITLYTVNFIEKWIEKNLDLHNVIKKAIQEEIKKLIHN